MLPLGYAEVKKLAEQGKRLHLMANLTGYISIHN